MPTHMLIHSITRSTRGALTALGCAALLMIASASPAVAAVYDLTGSTITIENGALPAPIVEPVTGTMELVDDGFGNYTVSGDLAYAFFVDINLGSLANGTIDTDLTVDVAGTGVRTGSILAFDNPVGYSPDGVILCINGTGTFNICDQAGFNDGVPTLVPEDTPDETFQRTFGNLTFGPGDATFTIEDFLITGQLDQTSQTLSLQGTLIPEPTTALLLGGGLLGLGLVGRRGRG